MRDQRRKKEEKNYGGMKGKLDTDSDSSHPSSIVQQRRGRKKRRMRKRMKKERVKRRSVRKNENEVRIGKDDEKEEGLKKEEGIEE